MTAGTPGRQVLARTLIVAACLSGTVGAPSADEAPGKLTYDARTRGPVPIPPGERDLQSVVAQPWFKVSDEGIPLEGHPSTGPATCCSPMPVPVGCCA